MEKELVTLVEEMLKYIESMECTIDGEWGSCRNFDELEKDEEVPELYYKLKKLLK